MAVIALQQGMGAYQRKTILMIANLRERCLPTSHRMAAFAICTELPAMNIRMAIRAALTNVFEYEAKMALRARNICMHAPKRVSGLIVIKLRIRPNRFPTCVRVALLAGD